MNWTEADVVAYMTRRGLPLDATLTVPARPAPDAMPEDAFLAEVRRYALDRGWLFHHVRDSRGCDPGFPDLCCVKPGHPLIIAELKTARGKLSKEQERWMQFLQQATGLDTYLWRPSDWPTITHILGG